ncbi:hypothetical protein KBC04_03810 [Candidatus Babeliales bacterium]|nr:hypothetical protein [Candidatus Babeliales bacterium]MBP9844194.1 hypothetical protein [Candidatus Babeliales bacterium]
MNKKNMLLVLFVLITSGQNIVFGFDKQVKIEDVKALGAKLTSKLEESKRNFVDQGVEFYQKQAASLLDTMIQDLEAEDSTFDKNAMRLSDYIKLFNAISDNHRNVVAIQGGNYHQQNEISHFAQAFVLEELKNDACSLEIMNENEPWRVHISQFMNSNGDYDKSSRLAAEYNKKYKLAESDKGALHDFDKDQCYNDIVYDQAWKKSHKTVADLIAVREQCGEEYDAFTKSLENRLGLVSKRG